MADEHGPRDLVIAEAEGRIEVGDFLVPEQLAFIGEHRKKQRRQALGVRSDHEFGMLVDRLGRPESAPVDAALPHALDLIEQSKAKAGPSQFARAVDYDVDQRPNARPDENTYDLTTQLRNS